jgi:hypothetical protein
VGSRYGNPAGRDGGERPDHEQSTDGYILAWPKTAGALDLRSAVYDIDVYTLAFQAAWLIALPEGMHRTVAPRLAAVMAELAERGGAVLDEAGQP